MTTQNIKSENTVYDFATTTEVENYAATYPEGSLNNASWRCCGDGLVARTIYCNGKEVGTGYANNGMCGYDAGEICNIITKPYSEVQEPEYIICPNCGEKLVEIDKQYENENPNASSYWYSEVISECNCNRCQECGEFNCYCNQ